MLNKIIADTYNKVRVKADEVRHTVTLNAAKARQALRLPHIGRLDAQLLERALENQASQPTSLTELHDLYIRWIAQFLTSSSETSLYYDSNSVNSYRGALDFALGVLSAGGFSDLVNGERDTQKSPGDLCSETSWITPYNKPLQDAVETDPHNNEIAIATPVELNSDIDSNTVQSESKQVQHSQSVTDGELQTYSKTNSSSASAIFPDGLTFPEVFLRSQAIEIALLSLARLSDVRELLVGPYDEKDDGNSTRGSLHRLMSLTMRGDTKVHQELLFLFCTVDLKSDVWEVHLRHLVELTALLKYDWQDEYYARDRRHILEEIDSLHAVLQLNSSLDENKGSRASHPNFSSDVPESSENTETTSSIGSIEHQTAAADEILVYKQNSVSSDFIRSSRRLAELYMAVHKNVTLAEKRRIVVEREVTKRLQSLQNSVDRLAEKFSTLGCKVADKKELLAAELKEAVTDAEVQLQTATRNKIEAATAVEKMETLKRQLLAELEAIEEKLGELREREQCAYRSFDISKKHWDSLVKTYAHKDAVATELKHQSVLHNLDMQNTRLLVVQTESVVGESMTSEMSNLQSIIAGNWGCFAEATRRYLDLECNRINEHQVKITKYLLFLEKQAKALIEERKKYDILLGQMCEPGTVINAELLDTPINPKATASNIMVTQRQYSIIEKARNDLRKAETLVSESQRTVLSTTQDLELIWKDVPDYFEALSAYLNGLLVNCSSGGSSTSHRSEDDEFVDVGDPVSSTPISGDSVWILNNHRDKIKELLSDARAKVNAAEIMYVTTKKLLAGNSSLLTRIRYTNAVT